MTQGDDRSRGYPRCPYQSAEFSEIKPVKDEIETAIKAMMEKAKSETAGGGAMHFSQAALNLAQMLAIFDNLKH